MWDWFNHNEEEFFKDFEPFTKRVDPLVKAASDPNSQTGTDL